MVLEATMIVLDNSEWMRNADYVPSRMEAQADAVHLLFNAKKQSHPENVVGLAIMSGSSPQVLVTLTSEQGKIIQALHTVKIHGQSQFSTALQIAQLALKHRQNKNQQQRIISFVASPVLEDEAELIKLAKGFKKNGLAVDIVLFGEIESNSVKLEAFMNAVNNNDNSHLVMVPLGPHILSDVLVSSPIVSMEGASGMGRDDYEFGVDPNMDPELALALRMSLEEEQARQQGLTGQSTTSAPILPTDNNAAALHTSSQVSSGKMADPIEDVNMHDLNEDEEVARAIAMSLSESVNDNTETEERNTFVTSVMDHLPGKSTRPSEDKQGKKSGKQ